ncbi:MAG: DUF4111 domain-containing protein [Nitriliruptorales bacterium]|nr:DUF4111 domain-containing protein [Nitriliruptorales bacterium]
MSGEQLTHAAARFAESVSRMVAARLGRHLVGVYIVGSAALGDLQPTSDLDMAAVVDDAGATPELDRLIGDVLGLAADAPVRGLEFVVYTAEQAARPDGSITLNINAGPQMETRLGSDADFWFAVDASILRETAVALVGPPAAEVFGAVPHDALLDVLRRSLQWHRDHGDRPHANVLTACRAWRYAAEGVWSSKSAAGEWAAARAPDAGALIDAAQAVRRGESIQDVNTDDARAFVERVRRVLAG